jgi:hypothetical protein
MAGVTGTGDAREPGRDETRDGSGPVEATGVRGRRDHDALLQAIIDRLAVEGAGHDHAELQQRLEAEIAAAGLTPMPRPWVDAVVSGAVNGDAYVVSAPAARRSGVPAPAHRVSSEIID